MIKLKSEKEIELMRESGRIVKETLDLIEKNIKPGVTTKSLNQIAHNFIINQGAVPSFKGYQGFPASICASPNEQVVHGIPNNKPLQNGDILSVDIGAYKNGYHGDAARTFPVGNIDEETKKLIQVTKESFYKAIEQFKEGNKIGDISFAIQEHIKQNNLGLVKTLQGHGVGQELHEDPSVPNFGFKQYGPTIKKGLVIAIEPIVNLGTSEVEFKPDGWTCVTEDGKKSAHYENTVALTKNGVEILTG